MMEAVFYIVDAFTSVPFRGNPAAVMLLTAFPADAEKECQALLARKLPRPAYDQCIKASHCFNLLDARGVISVTERASYIGRVRALAKASCEVWLEGQTPEGQAPEGKGA